MSESLLFCVQFLCRFLFSPPQYPFAYLLSGIATAGDDGNTASLEDCSQIYQHIVRLFRDRMYCALWARVNGNPYVFEMSRMGKRRTLHCCCVGGLVGGQRRSCLEAEVYRPDQFSKCAAESLASVGSAFRPATGVLPAASLFPSCALSRADPGSRSRGALGPCCPS